MVKSPWPGQPGLAGSALVFAFNSSKFAFIASNAVLFANSSRSSQIAPCVDRDGLRQVVGEMTNGHLELRPLTYGR